MRPGADCLLPFSVRHVLRVPAYFLERIAGCVSLVVCFLFWLDVVFSETFWAPVWFGKNGLRGVLPDDLQFAGTRLFPWRVMDSEHAVKVAGCTKTFAAF